MAQIKKGIWNYTSISKFRSVNHILGFTLACFNAVEWIKDWWLVILTWCNRFSGAQCNTWQGYGEQNSTMAYSFDVATNFVQYSSSQWSGSCTCPSITVSAFFSIIQLITLVLESVMSQKRGHATETPVISVNALMNAPRCDIVSWILFKTF